MTDAGPGPAARAVTARPSRRRSPRSRAGQTWVLRGPAPHAARPRSCPVLVGTAAAHPGHATGCVARHGHGPAPRRRTPVVWSRRLGALVVALAIQIGTNYANDYSDGIRGTDDVRVGPVRLVATGLAAPGAVKRARWSSFGVAAVVGLGAGLRPRRGGSCWWARPACRPGGSTPAGPAPTATSDWARCSCSCSSGWWPRSGTFYVQTLRLDAPAGRGCAAVAVGLLATALLLANNLRDIATDTAVRQADPGRAGRPPSAPAALLRRPAWSLPFVGVAVWACCSSPGPSTRPARPSPSCRWWPFPWPSVRCGWCWSERRGPGPPAGAGRHRSAAAGLRASCWPSPSGCGSRCRSSPGRARPGARGQSAVARSPGGRGPSRPRRRAARRWARVAGVRGTTARLALAPMAVDHPAPEGGELGVALRRRRPSTGIASSPSRPHSGCWVPVPARRRLRGQPGAACWPGARSMPGGLGSEGGEQRTGQPPVDEPRPPASTPVDRSSRRRPGPRRPPGGRAARRGRRCRPCPTIRTSASTRSGRARARCRQNRAAHRVAEVGRPPADLAQQRAPHRQVERRHPAEPPWPGTSTSTTWWSSGQVAVDAAPQPRRSG